ncbi:hypothetical protein OG264_16045 [Streptomyces xanthophaeus]|uniref:hypothetical protein n=1 Tax=Streptomyces xanthophaeus TaxID=67385 RepID=UPI00386C55F7|nr:hypothetical protein OG264_16045 [Streptomyces xanthophaeus]WST62154.1 hypothetical protein OG605_22390 [Streptomyces xanthophaeus]
MDRWDTLALLGVVLLGTGLALLAPWLGITAAGLVLLAVGLGGAIAAERTPAPAADDTDGGPR